MKRCIALFAALAALVWGAAAQQGTASAGPSFALTGAVDPQLAYSIENVDSAYASVPGYSYSNATAIGQIEGKLPSPVTTPASVSSTLPSATPRS